MQNIKGYMSIAYNSDNYKWYLYKSCICVKNLIIFKRIKFAFITLKFICLYVYTYSMYDMCINEMVVIL